MTPTCVKTRSYTCAICDGDFESTRSDEAALAEAKLLWGEAAPESEEESEIVCETCFLSLMAWHGKRVGRA